MSRMETAVLSGVMALCLSAGTVMAQALNQPNAGSQGEPSLTARATPINATPLGFELGYASLENVRVALHEQGEQDFRHVGPNPFTGGSLYLSTGRAFQRDSIQSIRFMFGKDDILNGILLTMSKDTSNMATLLGSKYPTVYDKIDRLLNYGEAVFEKGDSFIGLNATHLSSEMDVLYATKPLFELLMASGSANEAAESQRKQSLF